MGLFSSILEKLGIKKPVVKEAPVVKVNTDSRPNPLKPTTAPKPAPAAAPASKVYTDQARRPEAFKSAMAAAQVPVPMPMVDVVAKLEKMAMEKKEKLDWKVSIVDLLKVLGIDSSFAARKELAEELGCPPEKMKDSADMNIWLHKTVLAKIAENGGNIPKSLLD